MTIWPRTARMRSAERKLKRKMRTPYGKVGGRPFSVPAGGRVASAIDIKVRGLETHLCEWYMDKQSLVPKAFVFQSCFLLHTRNVLYPLLKK